MNERLYSTWLAVNQPSNPTLKLWGMLIGWVLVIGLNLWSILYCFTCASLPETILSIFVMVLGLGAVYHYATLLLSKWKFDALKLK